MHDPESRHVRIMDPPVPLADQPVPQIRRGFIYGVTEGSMGSLRFLSGACPRAERHEWHPSRRTRPNAGCDGGPGAMQKYRERDLNPQGLAPRGF